MELERKHNTYVVKLVVGETIEIKVGTQTVFTETVNQGRVSRIQFSYEETKEVTP